MIESASDARVDPLDARAATAATGLLHAFNAVALITAADVHVATRLSSLAGEEDEVVTLAAALAVRAPRLGHVFVDLATVAETASIEGEEEPVDLSLLPWPEPEAWRSAVRGSPLVASGEDAADDGARPLRLLGTRLYLDRYWREERQVAADLIALSTRPVPAVDADALSAQLARLFGRADDERQRAAAAAAVSHRLAVVAGGPGTGKTTTVARIVAVLAEQARAAGERPPLVALAAPTAKAAARLQEAVHAEAPALHVAGEVRTLLLELQASTLHRLLGWRPGSHSRFAHDRDNRLPHDVVIVDETSMISLSLMARLIEAVRHDGRLILVGDPGQLTSIEAGVVLGDIVGPAGDAEDAARSTGPIAPGIVVLSHVYRYGGAIAGLAEAIRRGDPDDAIARLAAGSSRAEVSWVPAAAEEAELPMIRTVAVDTGAEVVRAARRGDADGALAALSRFRLLCAHRRGPHGVSAWTGRQQAWLGEEIDDLDLEQRDYVGRPLLVTENDYELGLFNGDTGVVVQEPGGGSVAVFERGRFSPLRLGAVETLYAMTIHKSQGSQFDTAAVLLPPAGSPILTRELLYTAVTRARARLVLVGTEETVRAAVERPVTRASGLRARLWGPVSPSG